MTNLNGTNFMSKYFAIIFLNFFLGVVPEGVIEKNRSTSLWISLSKVSQ